jgi:F-type H+-transporting ATPase subunit epsilon
MTDKITFDLVSPERLVLSEEAEMVTIPGVEGDMGVMPGHAPVVSTLRPGFIAVSGGQDGNRKYFVMGGFAEVTAAKLTVLAEEAVPAAEFDAAALDQKITRAQEELASAKTDAAKDQKQFLLSGLEGLRTAV